MSTPAIWTVSPDERPCPAGDQKSRSLMDVVQEGAFRIQTINPAPLPPRMHEAGLTLCAVLERSPARTRTCWRAWWVRSGDADTGRPVRLGKDPTRPKTRINTAGQAVTRLLEHLRGHGAGRMRDPASRPCGRS